IRTARALAASQALEPLVQFRVLRRIASIEIARLRTRRGQRCQQNCASYSKRRSPSHSGADAQYISWVRDTALMRRVAAGIDPVAHLILLLHLPQGAEENMHLAGQLFRQV